MKTIYITLCLLLASISTVFAQQGTHWSCDYTQYENDMTVYLAVTENNAMSTNADRLEVGAFVDGECRGVATSNTNGIFTLRVWSNTAGEKVTFHVAVKNEDIDITDTSSLTDVTFTSDATIGTPGAPRTIEIGSLKELEENLALENALKVDMDDWSFSSTVRTIDGLRYYLDETNKLAEFIGFNYTSSLTELNIPALVNYDGVSYCVVAVINPNRYSQSNIKSVTLPKSLRSIGDYAFYYYTNLTYLEIPENVVSIGKYAFYYDENLRSMKVNAVVPPTVGSFYTYNSYIKIRVPAESFHDYRIASVWGDYVLIGGDGVAVSTGKIAAGDLGYVILDDASYLQEVNKLVIDEGSLNSDDWATIENMTNLIELDLGGVTMTELPSSAFYDRWAIEKLVLPHNLQTIGTYAFRGSGIKEITIPESVTTINTCAFYNCDSLTNITIPSSIKAITSSCFYDCDNLTSVSLSDNITEINYQAFSGCEKLSAINLPSKLTTLGTYAFSGCPIKSITIPSGLKEISEGAFENNNALESLTIPSTVESIKSCAFYNCTSLQNVEFNEGLQNIYSSAFYNCYRLTEVILPSSLIRCQDYPFYNCSGITRFESRAVLPPATSDDCPMGSTVSSKVTLYVPSWSLSEYKSAEGWMEFPTVEKSDFMPQNVIVNKDFYFTLKDTLDADYRPNIVMSCSDVYSTDASGHTNYERGNLTISGRSKLAVNDFSILVSPYAKYFADQNVNYGYDYDYYHTNMNSTCLLVNGEMRAENVTMSLTTYNSRWQFVTFPFDVNVADITPVSDNISWVIRRHNGRQRAQGNTDKVWEDMNTTRVNADAVPTFSPVATDGNTIQYLYNVETGAFVLGGNEWNTRASVSTESGMQFKVQLNDDGAFTLNTNTGSAWSAIDCDESLNGWIDGAGRDGTSTWHITLTGENTYELTNDQAGTLKWGVDPTLYDTRVYFKDADQASTWAFVNEDDYYTYLKAISEVVITDTLKAGVGYIMHTYNPDNSYSCFNVSPIKNTVNRQKIFVSDDVTYTLEENLAEFDHNRSWNLIGNPYPCFYDTRFLDFSAPFMVWNSYSQTYVAYNPADDAYILSPGEAFFVQRPFEQESLTFVKEGRQTNRYAREMDSSVKAMTASANKRTICNITIAQDSLSDRTRIVFNDKASVNYEMNCDAAKFASTERTVPQIFTVSGNTRYAINERPTLTGDVRLGVYCGTNGEYTINMPKEFDGNVILEDKTLGLTTELTPSKGYSFSASAGEYLNRFVLHFQNSATGISTVNQNAETEGDVYYNLQGMKVNKINANGIYIKNGKKVVVK